jgi:hypothetical protein
MQRVNFVLQTRRGLDDGNCFAACLASLLGLEHPDEVPPYLGPIEDMRPHLRELDDWLRENHPGLALVVLNARNFGDDGFPDFIADDTYWIASYDPGDGPAHHSVVMRGTQPVWDPELADDVERLRDWPIRAATFLREAEPEGRYSLVGTARSRSCQARRQRARSGDLGAARRAQARGRSAACRRLVACLCIPQCRFVAGAKSLARVEPRAPAGR